MTVTLNGWSAEPCRGKFHGNSLAAWTRTTTEGFHRGLRACENEGGDISTGGLKKKKRSPVVVEMEVASWRLSSTYDWMLIGWYHRVWLKWTDLFLPAMIPSYFPFGTVVKLIELKHDVYCLSWDWSYLPVTTVRSIPQSPSGFGSAVTANTNVSVRSPSISRRRKKMVGRGPIRLSRAVRWNCSTTNDDHHHTYARVQPVTAASKVSSLESPNLTSKGIDRRNTRIHAVGRWAEAWPPGSNLSTGFQTGGGLVGMTAEAPLSTNQSAAHDCDYAT